MHILPIVYLLAFHLCARLLPSVYIGQIERGCKNCQSLRLESSGTPDSFHFHPKINLTASCVRKWMRVVQERMIFQRTTRLTTAAAAAGGAAAAAVAAAVAASREVAVYLDLTFGLVS